MKKLLFILISFFVVGRFVNAETFFEGNYISGEYINKEINGVTYYMTMQYIKDSRGNIVYCLEPFVTFSEGKSYVSYVGDLSGYKNLSKEQKRKIELITYYGYGYDNRKTDKWYVVTQYLVWKTVDSDANVYFTKTLNGKKIDKYSKEMEEVLKDVEEHNFIPSFVKNYSVNYGSDLIISQLNTDYEIISSDYEYKINNGLSISNVFESGNIKVRKKSNKYENKIAIFDSTKSQDLIRPGNIENNIMNINVEVTKGDITLDIKNDYSVYTIESDFSNTCYEISKNNDIVDKICTSKDPIVYKTNDLPFGNYVVKQVSVGLGYKKDVNVYNVSIDNSNSHPKLVLYNYLLKNKIEIIKRACRNDACNYESDALFQVYDKNKNLIMDLITDNNGYTSITLGYGSYEIIQKNGIHNYTLEKPFVDKIVDEITLHKHELYNYYIKKEPGFVEDVEPMPDKVEILEEPKEEEQKEEFIDEIPLPPDTRVDKKGFFEKIIIFFKKIFKVIFDNSYII